MKDKLNIDLPSETLQSTQQDGDKNTKKSEKIRSFKVKKAKQLNNVFNKALKSI